VASIAEEVDNPGRALPLGMLSSIAVVTLLYVLMLLVTVGVLDDDALSGSLTPIATAAGAVLGPGGFWTLLAASLLAFVTTANAGIMSASRYPLAMSRDGMLPAVLGRVGGRGRVPYAAIAATGLLIVVSLLLPLEELVKAASTVVIASFALANLSVIILRESRLQNYRPSFRVPLYPWLQFAALVLFALLIVDMGYQALLTSLGFVTLGFFAYLFYGRKQARAEYALLALMERIVNRRLTSHRLESELREILYERDRIARDRFDLLVEAAPVLDLPAGTGREEAFRVIAEKLAGKTGRDATSLRALLREREEESSTVISDFAAVPHLVIEGTETFELILVRSGTGLRFSEEHPAVHAMFVLAGTPDQRNFHLRCLAAIAQVLQSPGFEERWMNARDAHALRDAVLLGKRRRAQGSSTTTR
jgi:mannitol/fructose-specific phosphotransferase system IIA component (Ntr-type)